MVDQVADVVVTGQRKPSGNPAPFPQLEQPVWPAWVAEKQEIPPTDEFNPCRFPRGKKEWDRDAQAASTVKDLRTFANSNPPDAAPEDRGWSAREYGAVLWELPDGSMIRGPMTSGALTFRQANQSPNGRAGVALDWTLPVPGAVPYGTVHTHPPGGHRPSGIPTQTGLDDYGVLTYTQNLRDYYGAGATRTAARLYIAADNLVGPGETQEAQINIYDNRNIEQAVSGDYTGPNVNPDGAPCP